jgi:hypothetical protein
MSKDKFDNLLEDDTQEVVAKASSVMSEDKKETKTPHKLLITFEDKEEFLKVKRYAKSKKLSVNSFIMNMLANEGII